MRGAVIDLGTNTFGLIVFEEKASKREILIRDKAFVNLGEGGINSNIITQKAMDRAYFAMDHFVDTCRSFGVYPEQIRAFGTSALRDAKNAKEFIDRSEEHTSELQSRPHLVCRLLLEKKKKKIKNIHSFSFFKTCNTLGLNHLKIHKNEMHFHSLYSIPYSDFTGDFTVYPADYTMVDC